MKINSIESYTNASNIKVPTFKRAWPEHMSWGANYSKTTNKTNFKLFSFPEAKSVFVEISNKANAGLSNFMEKIVKVIALVGTGFVIDDIMSSDDKSKIYKMEKKNDGIFEIKDVDATPEDKYRYIIVKDDKTVNLVKDPYSKKQESILGWSSIYDKDAYQWENTDWLEGKDSRRIVRNPQSKLRGLEKLVIEEINVPTLSKEGTFDKAKEYIDTIAEKGIVTAVELLPVENTYSLQWGYDGVDKFAVNEKLGGPDKLKEFIDYTHGKGLNVIMDMVPNHQGPDGNYLATTGPYRKGDNEFGTALNYEGKNNKYVRDWMVNAALMWAKDYNVDGIRLDMTSRCDSDYLLKQIVLELNEHAPNVFIIAEDGRENKPSVTRYETSEVPHDGAINYIDNQVDFISNGGWKSSPVNIGFDSEWDFRFMTMMKNAIINSGSNLLDDMDSKIKDSQYRVKYVMSHDEIGNWDGTRLIPKIMSNNLGLFFNISGIDDAEKGQKAAHAGQALSELTASGILDKMHDEELYNYEKKLGINNFISKQQIEDTFNTALAKHKLSLGTVMTIPGPKMFFQADDEADLAYFKFFREFSDEKLHRSKRPQIKDEVIRHKGYDTLEEVARPDCIIRTKQKGGKYANLTQQMQLFNKDLADLLYSNEAMNNGDIVSTYKDYNHNVHIHQLKDGDKELLIIKNFGSGFHRNNYEFFGFPHEGIWKEVFNSDDKKYGGSGMVNEAREDITNKNQKLNLAPNSLLILQKIK